MSDRININNANIIKFQDDSYFRESLSDALEVFGCNDIRIMDQLALAVFKPEAVVGRRITPAIHQILNKGFSPCWMGRLQFDRHICQNLWRYIWKAASVDRIIVSQLLTTATDSLVIIFCDTNPIIDETASSRLSHFKGPAIMERTNMNTLRSLLNPPNRMMNFVHVSDETIDLIRELGVLYETSQRLSIYQNLAENYTKDISLKLIEMVDDLNDLYPEIPLIPSCALSRLNDAIVSLSSMDYIDKNNILEIKILMDDMERGKKISWRKLSYLLVKLKLQISKWDIILIGTQYIDYDSK